MSDLAIDTSAIVAILKNEAEQTGFGEAIERADQCLMSIASYVESAIVLENRLGFSGRRDLDLLIARAGIEMVPVDVDQAYLARDAFRRFGKGKHPAGLNYGDCFSYALAKATGLPLLFKGENFGKTDVQRVEG